MHHTSLAYVTAYQFYAINKAKTAQERTNFLRTFQRVLEERIPHDLDVKIDDLEFRLDNRIKITLIGPNKDECQFVSRILQELTGRVIDANNIPKNTPLIGQLTSIGSVGFGVFVDIGIEGPSKEVLIPLFRLRQQLVGNDKLSTKEIIHLYGLMNHLPVELEVTKLTYEKKGKPKVEGQFSENFLVKIRQMVEEGWDTIFTTGVSRQMIKKTLAKRGHTIDIMQIDRLGPMEAAVRCKSGTTAAGLIAHIGKFLPNCRMTVFNPERVAKYW
ncbi:MAG: hypothetical protein DRO88_00290 [Promethearchaeia archaeon]|nr:MAG: hypothetical protein DRO88_00290 [Candidatus Lokiarchaeia archaeon]